MFTNQHGKPAPVRYLATDMAIEVAVSTAHEAQAIERFAKANGFACPAPQDARPVYHCIARTHPNGEVLWA